MKRLRDGHMVESQPRDEPIPELVLDAPLDDLDEAERRTLQTQWADALKQVQSLRHSGPHSERWSGAATEIHTPKSFTAQDSHRARTSLVPAAKSLDQWNYYPGPSVTRSETQPSSAWPSSGAPKGRGSRSFSTTVANLEPSVEVGTQQQGRAQVMDQVASVPSLDETPKMRHSAGGGRVQRTQSHRYGRVWGQKREGDPMTGESIAGACEVPGSPRGLKKAVSMREGGAHADAVREMARAYTGTVVGGAGVTLECASCGRSLGVVVQGNPGVDTAFCHACRPSPVQWKRSGSTGSTKKKTNGFMRFCRKILRLEKK
jgi:hypothetical protein